MKELFNYFNSITNSDNASKIIFSSKNVKLKKLKKDQFLLKPNKKTDKVFFVFNGCLRSFHLDLQGKEHTLQFALKFSWISDYISLYSDNDSILHIQAITDCVVFEFKMSSIYKLCSKYSNFSLLYRKSLEEHIANLGTRIINQLQLSAEQRYENFLHTYPGVDQLAMNYHIASFLGITQESLSRIRANKKK